MQGKPIKILVSESGGFSTIAAEQLRQAGELILADVDREGLLSAVRDVHVLWVRLRHRIDAEVLSNARCLNLIVTPTTGLNHIDLEETKDRGIQVLSLHGETEFLRNVRATAELTIALILALLRRVPAASRHVQEGSWNRELFKGCELYGKTVGIVGYGRLGRVVARYLKPFEARILAADPNVDAASVEPTVTAVSLTELLQQSDIVTVHVNLCHKTRGLFGMQQFSSMKPGAWFINTSRGELVDESVLLDALRSGRLAGAALDVVSNEYLDGIEDHPLIAHARKYDNLIITPHIGGCTIESMEKTELFLAEKALQRLAG